MQYHDANMQWHAPALGTLQIDVYLTAIYTDVPNSTAHIRIHSSGELDQDRGCGTAGRRNDERESFRRFGAIFGSGSNLLVF
jgi:hypothetical protein